MAHRRPPPPSLGAWLRHRADSAGAWQKFFALGTAAILFFGVVGGLVSKYAPWAWAGDVKRVEEKVDTLTTTVLESQVNDLESRVGALTSKRALTSGEADYLRSLRQRLADVQKKLDAAKTPAAKK